MTEFQEDPTRTDGLGQEPVGVVGEPAGAEGATDIYAVMPVEDEPPGRDAPLQTVAEASLDKRAIRLAVTEAEIHRADGLAPNVTAKLTKLNGDDGDPSHFDPVTNHVDGELQLPPNYVRFDSPEALHEGLIAMYPEGWITPEGPIEESEELRYTVEHEAAHEEAAQLVHQGDEPLESCYLLSFGAGGRWTAEHLNTNIKTTRLGTVIVSAAGPVPSIDDMKAVRAGGYRNVQHVVGAALQTGTPLPESLARFADPNAPPDPTRTAAHLYQRGWNSSPREQRFTRLVDIERANAFAPLTLPDGTVPSVPGDLTDAHAARTAHQTWDRVRVPGYQELIVPPHVIVAKRDRDADRIVGDSVRHLGFDVDIEHTTEAIDRETDRALLIGNLLDYDTGFLGIAFAYDPIRELVVTDCRYITPGLEPSPTAVALINIGVSKPTAANYEVMKALGFESRRQVLRAAIAEGLRVPPYIERMLDE